MAGSREQRFSVVVRRTTTSSGGAFYYSDTGNTTPEFEQPGAVVAHRLLPRHSRLSRELNTQGRPRQDPNLGPAE